MRVKDVLNGINFLKENTSNPLLIPVKERDICKYNHNWVEDCIYEYQLADSENDFNHYHLSQDAINDIREGKNFEQIFKTLFKNNNQNGNSVFMHSYMQTLQKISLGFFSKGIDYLNSVHVSIHNYSEDIHISFNSIGKDTIGINAKLQEGEFFYSYGNEVMENCESRSGEEQNKYENDFISKNYKGDYNHNFDFVETYNPAIKEFNCDTTIVKTRNGYEMTEKSFGPAENGGIEMYNTTKTTTLNEEGKVFNIISNSQIDETCCVIPVDNGAVKVLGYAHSTYDSPNFEQ